MSFNFQMKISGSKMYLMKYSIYYIPVELRTVTDTDFVDNLNIYHGNYQADSKFLNMLDKLIFLRSIAFCCRFWNGSHSFKYRVEGTGKAYQYFALNSDDRPAAHSMTLTSNLGHTDFTLADGKFSTPDEVTNHKSRITRNVFISTENNELDINSRTCFSGSAVEFHIEVW